MHIRCPKCRATTWLITQPQLRPADPRCRSCGGTLTLVESMLEGAASEHMTQLAATLTATTPIDLHSANAVILGIMPLEQAIQMCSQLGQRTRFESLEMIEDSAPRARPQRRRQSEAGRLASSSTSFSVTSLFMMLAVGLAAAMGIYWSASRGWDEQRLAADRQRALARMAAAPPPEARLPPTAMPDSRPAAKGPATGPGIEIQKDAEGRVTQIKGPAPDAVLQAIGAAWPGGEYIPLEVARGGVSGRSRFALLRLRQDLASVVAVPIFQDRLSGRWTAGDERTALRFHDASRLRLRGTAVHLPAAGMPAIAASPPE